MWQSCIRKGTERVEMCRYGSGGQQRNSRFDEAHELAAAGAFFGIHEHD